MGTKEGTEYLSRHLRTQVQHLCHQLQWKQDAGCSLDLLVLHRVHYHPVEGVDVLPNEVLKHDECLHQKILQ